MKGLGGILVAEGGGEGTNEARGDGVTESLVSSQQKPMMMVLKIGLPCVCLWRRQRQSHRSQSQARWMTWQRFCLDDGRAEAGHG